MISNAIHASTIVSSLKQEAGKLNYNKDLHKLIGNLDKLVANLSNAEVKARQSHKQSVLVQPKQDLVEAINYAEKMLMIMRLSQ